MIYVLEISLLYLGWIIMKVLQNKDEKWQATTSDFFQMSNSNFIHYDDVIMTTMASQITSLTIVYSTVYSGADQRKHQRSVSLASVREIHWRPVNSTHKWPVTRQMFPFDDVIMFQWIGGSLVPWTTSLTKKLSNTSRNYRTDMVPFWNSHGILYFEITIDS